ncbi:MAG: SDR family oxidoreductase [Candidatus Odyssella sp.]|nr:SDR family oxidoreductase [Candidatus Odyssella sp.]
MIPMPAGTAAFSLAGQSALVIGGGSGIGRAIAIGLAGAGARTSVSGRRKDWLEEAIGAIGAKGPAGRPYPLDARDPRALGGLLAQLQKDGGTPDIVVNAQGVIATKPALEIGEDDYDRVMDTNVKSVFFSCLVFGRAMLARGSGSIVNISSLAAYRGWPGSAVYGMSKHALKSLTETFGAEWAAQGVRVNAIAPGFFITDLNRAMPEERKKRALDRTPMRRFGELPELVGAAVYLCSPAARYVTGATIAVDGGYLATGI